ncbi:uncharacterized protein LOC144302702 isoform X2 [Canis aureus]
MLGANTVSCAAEVMRRNRDTRIRARLTCTGHINELPASLAFQGEGLCCQQDQCLRTCDSVLAGGRGPRPGGAKLQLRLQGSHTVHRQGSTAPPQPQLSTKRRLP